jgi:hypothetical protein
MVFGVHVNCHVLDDGTRMIEEVSLEQLFHALEQGRGEVGDLARLTAFTKGAGMPPQESPPWAEHALGDVPAAGQCGCVRRAPHGQ